MAEALQNTNAPSTPRVRLISTRQPDDPGLDPIDRLAAPASTRSNPAFLEQMMAVMTAIAAVLAARFLLLLSALGAFTLALLTVGNPDAMKLAVNVAFDLLVLIPVTYLYLQKG